MNVVPRNMRRQTWANRKIKPLEARTTGPATTSRSHIFWRILSNLDPFQPGDSGQKVVAGAQNSNHSTAPSEHGNGLNSRGQPAVGRMGLNGVKGL